MADSSATSGRAASGAGTRSEPQPQPSPAQKKSGLRAFASRLKRGSSKTPEPASSSQSLVELPRSTTSNPAPEGKHPGSDSTQTTDIPTALSPVPIFQGAGILTITGDAGSAPATDDTTETKVTISKTVDDTMDRPIRLLWDDAWKQLDEEEPELAKKYDERIETTASMAISSATARIAGAGSLSKTERLRILLDARIKELEDGEWKLGFRGNQFAVKDFVGPVVSVIGWASNYIGDAAQASPYTSVAWAGVSLMLPLVLNPQKQNVELAEGLEEVAFLIRQCSLRQSMYNQSYEARQGMKIKDLDVLQHETWRHELKLLYVKILKFQATCICHSMRGTAGRTISDMVLWNNWKDLRVEIETRRENLEAIEVLWRDFKLQEHWRVEADCHREMMAKLSPMADEVLRIRSVIEIAQKEKMRQDLLNWISKKDFSSRLNDIRDRREEFTGDWLIKFDVYKDWKTTPRSFLWLFGNAGTGKSYLSSKAIEDLKEACQKSPFKAMAYYYFNFNNQEGEDVKTMLRAVLRQLCAARPNIPDEVEKLATTLKDHGATASCKDLEESIWVTADSFEAVYLVVDALDECTTSGDKRRDLLASLTRLQATLPPNVHFLVTSRKESDITAAFGKFGHTPSAAWIDLHKQSTRQAMNKDIRIYIEQRFLSSEFDHIPDEKKELAQEMLLQKADGMYQYVALQLVNIRDSQSEDIPAVLASLPTGLDETYLRMLKNIDPKYKSQARRILIWVALSRKHPWQSKLNSKMLAEASVIDPDAEPPFQPSARLTQLEKTPRLLALLPGILNEVLVESWRPDTEISKIRPEIRFSHFSVQEFLLSEANNSEYRIEEDQGNLLIAETCLCYHLYACSHTNTITEKKDIEPFPLWEYAMEFWMDHLNSVDEQHWPRRVKERAKSVLQPHTEELFKMIQIWNPGLCVWGRPDLERAAETIAHPVYYVSASGNWRVLSWLIKNDDAKQVKILVDFPSKEERYKGPLQVAAEKSHLQMVRLLLDHGADVNAQGGKFGNALQAAVWRRSIELVTLLLDHGADINTQGGKFGNALQAAVFNKSLEMVTLLLNHGADVNAQCGKYHNALHTAAWRGSIELVTLLLDHKADVNAQGGKVGNALHAAAWSGSIELVTLLLDHGADLNAQGKKYGNALQAAAWSGSVELITLLLDHGADVNAQGGKFGNALQAAAWNQSVEVVTLLLDHGADINAQGGKFGSALRAAKSAESNGDILAKLLMERGAVNSLGEDGHFIITDVTEKDEGVYDSGESTSDEGSLQDD